MFKRKHFISLSITFLSNRPHISIVYWLNKPRVTVGRTREIVYCNDKPQKCVAYLWLFAFNEGQEMYVNLNAFSHASGTDFKQEFLEANDIILASPRAPTPPPPPNMHFCLDYSLVYNISYISTFTGNQSPRSVINHNS